MNSVFQRSKCLRDFLNGRLVILFHGKAPKNPGIFQFMEDLLPSIDGIGKCCSFPEDLFGFLWMIPKVFLRYDPFDFLEPFFFFI